MYLDIQEVLARIGPADRVLDLGGWERVFPRADVVVDLNPYETRKVIHGNIPERFTRNTWIRADFCRPAFWETIGDNTFDFIIVSHTLEDVRDPLYLCSQIIRCGKAGYIEVPSKFRECAKITATDSFAGYDHHRWIIEPMPYRTGLIFKAKLSWAHHQDYLGDARRHFLRSYHYHFNGFFWHGSFRYLEHFPKGSVLESTDLVWFYEHLVYDRAPDIIFDLVPNSSHPSDGSCLWVTEYRLPSEPAPDAASHPQSPTLHV